MREKGEEMWGEECMKRKGKRKKQGRQGLLVHSRLPVIGKGLA